ncbi:hypothetical protein CYMTET_28184, partial [Cymbomonas tetramitiformis]
PSNPPTTASPSTTLSPTAAPSASQYFALLSGDCGVTSGGRCIESPGWGVSNTYPPDIRCDFQVLQAGVLSVVQFDLEAHGCFTSACDQLRCYDSVDLHSEAFCGNDGPDGRFVSSGDYIVFKSDSIYENAGFRLCWEEPKPAVVIDDARNGTRQLSEAISVWTHLEAYPVGLCLPGSVGVWSRMEAPPPSPAPAGEANYSVSEIELVVDVLLTAELPLLVHDVNISGRCGNDTMSEGGHQCFISGGYYFKIFQVYSYHSRDTPVKVHLSSLFLIDGYAANSSGAALRNWESFVTLTDCWLHRNFATVAGGGIAAVGGSSNGHFAQVVLRNCSVMDNSAEYGGGLYTGQSASMQVHGGTVANNFAVFGAGLFLDYLSQGVVNGGTWIAGNVARLGGGGIFAFTHTVLELTGGVEVKNNSVIETVLEELQKVSTKDDFEIMGGGGILIQKLSSVLLHASRVIQNYASIVSPRLQEGGGGVALGRHANLKVLGGSVVSENFLGVSCCGGGIFMLGFSDGAGPLTTVLIGEGSIVHSNKGNYGAGIGSTGMHISITIDGATVSSNESPAIGGGICVWNHNSWIYIYNGSRISDNVALTSGGGIYVPRPSALSIFSNVSIDGNRAGDGAGIWIGTGCTVEIGLGSCISRNTATNDGAGIFIANDSSVSITMSNITDNRAGESGGGVYAGPFSKWAMHGGQLARNEGLGGGGGAYVHYGTMTSPTMTLINGTLITENTATNGLGGGLFLHRNTRTSITGGTVVSNCQAFSGGGFSAMQSWLEVDAGVAVVNNRALFQGGGINSVGSKVHIEDCAVQTNHAEYGGGGIAIVQSMITLSRVTLDEGLTESSLNATATRVSGSTAPRGGGALISDSRVELNHSMVVDNIAETSGGGASLDNSLVYLTNCTLLRNVAGDDGGGVAVGNGSRLVVHGSTLEENEASRGGGLALGGDAKGLDMIQSSFLSNVAHTGPASVLEWPSVTLSTTFRELHFVGAGNRSSTDGLPEGRLGVLRQPGRDCFQGSDEGLSRDSVSVMAGPQTAVDLSVAALGVQLVLSLELQSLLGGLAGRGLLSSSSRWSIFCNSDFDSGLLGVAVPQLTPPSDFKMYGDRAGLSPFVDGCRHLDRQPARRRQSSIGLVVKYHIAVNGVVGVPPPFEEGFQPVSVAAVTPLDSLQDAEPQQVM